jgi:hypothetical protein
MHTDPTLFRLVEFVSGIIFTILSHRVPTPSPPFSKTGRLFNCSASVILYSKSLKVVVDHLLFTYFVREAQLQQPNKCFYLASETIFGKDKKSQNSRNHGLSYYLIMEGSGSVPFTNVSGSGRPKTSG